MSPVYTLYATNINQNVYTHITRNMFELTACRFFCSKVLSIMLQYFVQLLKCVCLIESMNIDLISFVTEREDLSHD